MGRSIQIIESRSKLSISNVLQEKEGGYSQWYTIVFDHYQYVRGTRITLLLLLSLLSTSEINVQQHIVVHKHFKYACINFYFECHKREFSDYSPNTTESYLSTVLEYLY